MRTYFSDFAIPVKASRIKRAKKYSDVIITRPSEGVHGKVVKAQRPKRAQSGWEPEEMVVCTLNMKPAR